MVRQPYPTDLTDREWAILAPLIPAAKPGGRPRSVDLREILNGIFYALRAGGSWRMLPHDLPPWPTVYGYFRAWHQDGVWERLTTALREQGRRSVGRAATPSAAILDSQSVKTTEKGGHADTTLGRRSTGASVTSSSIPSA